MTKLRMLLLVCACALIPATARADDGGWWEWLQGLSGPKLWGAGTDLHLFCLDKDGHPFRCEELFRKFPMTRSYEDIRHQFDVAISVYGNYGMPLTDATTTGKESTIWALKVMGLYQVRVHPMVNVGAGAGVMPFFSADFPTFSRMVVSPVRVRVTPFKTGGPWKKGFYLHSEVTYFTKGFTGADFGNAASKLATDHETIPTAGFGWDFRRR
jgi:hypothetical protein